MLLSQGRSELLWAPGARGGMRPHFWKALRLPASPPEGGSTKSPRLPGGPRAVDTGTDLQVRDVPVDGHGGRHAVLGHVLVVAGARLAVHSVDAWDGDALVASSNVSVAGRGTLPPLGQGLPPPGTGTGPRGPPPGRGQRPARPTALHPPRAAPPGLGPQLTCSPSSPWARASLGPSLGSPCSPAGRPTPGSAGWRTAGASPPPCSSSSHLNPERERG